MIVCCKCGRKLCPLISNYRNSYRIARQPRFSFTTVDCVFEFLSGGSPFLARFFKRVVKARYAFLACTGFLLKTNDLKRQGPVPERPSSVRMSRRR